MLCVNILRHKGLKNGGTYFVRGSRNIATLCTLASQILMVMGKGDQFRVTEVTSAVNARTRSCFHASMSASMTEEREDAFAVSSTGQLEWITVIRIEPTKGNVSF